MKPFCSQAYTAKGLVTLNHSFTNDYYSFVFKGYPNALKQKLLNEVSSMSEYECETDCDYNGSPVSLICNNRKFRISDGTDRNHTETLTYGITDSIINLNQFQDSGILKRNKDKALLLFKEIKKEEKRCVGFLSAAHTLTEDCKRIEIQNINRPQINRFSAKLWKKYGTSPTGKIGSEKKYFADTLTSDGVSFPFDRFSDMCRNISVISDFSSSVSYLIADKIRLYALSCGFDVITFTDCLNLSSIRHIIIPELEYGIYSERIHSAYELKNSKRIRKNRFMNSPSGENFRNRINFSKRACEELFDEASKTLKNIERLKNQLDEIYISATDSDRFMSECLDRIGQN